MSKKLGFLERRILEALRTSEFGSYQLDSLVWWLSGKINHPGDDYPDEIIWERPYKAVPNIYKSVYRAVKSLERKGFVHVVRKRNRRQCPFGWRCHRERGLNYPYAIVELVRRY